MSETDPNILLVQEALGHVFGDIALLEDALTHSSFANEKPKIARTDNERLEFMGDAVLQWIVSDLLWERFPGAAAGEMTRRRADLVCEEGLAAIAQDVGIGRGLRLGKGEARTGGRDKPRLLASAFEACIAAVYLDGGAVAAAHTCRRVFEPRLEEAAPGARDFKTRLQEALQRAGKAPPNYQLVETRGPDHRRSFEVAVEVDARELGRAEGRSKLEAEQAAAERALEHVEE